MKIDLVTRSRYAKLYERMKESVNKTTDYPVSMLLEVDEIGDPRLVESYQRLIDKSDADIIGLIQDDIEFLDAGWDTKVKNLFIEYKPDILGVIGSTRYDGGGVFDVGYVYGRGMIADIGGVKILSTKAIYEKVRVIDGCLMFISRDFLKREPLDPKLDGLFYWDIDLCLRSNKVALTSSFLVRHSKTEDLYGVYPKDMKPRSHYQQYFDEKHGTAMHESKSQACSYVPMEQYRKIGQTQCYRMFEKKYLCKLAS